MKEDSIDDLKKKVAELQASNSMLKKDLLKALRVEEVLIAAGLISIEKAKQARDIVDGLNS